MCLHICSSHLLNNLCHDFESNFVCKNEEGKPKFTHNSNILLSSVLSQHQQVYPDIESRNLDTTDKNIIHIIQPQQEYEYRKKIQNMPSVFIIHLD